MINLVILLAVLLVPLTAVTSFADQIRVFVTGIDAVGVQNRDEMKSTLQTLLASRLNGNGIVAVENVTEADVLVSGAYISIGKVFSVDAVAKNVTGRTLARAFVQGESRDELIPSVGTLAEKLSSELVKVFSYSNPDMKAAVTAAMPANALSSKSLIMAAPGGEIIRPDVRESAPSGDWISPRLNGSANLMEFGTTLPDSTREIFLAGGQRLAYYRLGTDMKLVAEAELNPAEKIISLDTIPNSDGALDIYLTIIRSGEPNSEVWRVKGEKLVRVVENLPYYFRGVSLAGGPKKLYAQSAGREEDFYGDVFEATRSGSAVILKNPVKMPRYGIIYNFNQFRGRDGKAFTVVVNPDGYLIVYDQQLSELWRSNDKYGGSELYFQKEAGADVRVTGDPYRWIFMNQRIQVSSKGEILVGKNDGFWVLGNARSYKRGAVYCLAWNGSSLEEKWRTRETQDYMPDYFFDEGRNELLILQTVQRPGIVGQGASSLSIKKIK